MDQPSHSAHAAGSAAYLDSATFLADFHHTTLFGATQNGGIDRQAGTPEHGAVRDWFEKQARKRGFHVLTDQIGNIFAIKEWLPGAPFVLIGSHLDSQPLAGRFDGTYGVVAALHAASALDKSVHEGLLVPEVNIAVVDWFNEEGSRFAPSVMGSSVFAGLLDLEETLGTLDPNGVSVHEALSAIGRRGEAVDLPLAGYAEIHIEQGRRLERAGICIGVVERSWHTQKLLVRVTGEQSHTGATLMADRRDALVTASHVVIAVEELVEDFEPESIVTSVGKFDVEPNSPIVVPRQVDLVVDIRADDKADVLRARELLKKRMEQLAHRRSVTIEAEDFDVRPTQMFSEQSVALGQKAASDEGEESLVLATLAGHDSVALNRVTPSVMLFVPSVDGVSHCEREFTGDEDLVTGLRVLTNLAGRLVSGELGPTKFNGSASRG